MSKRWLLPHSGETGSVANAFRMTCRATRKRHSWAILNSDFLSAIGLDSWLRHYQLHSSATVSRAGSQLVRLRVLCRRDPHSFSASSFPLTWQRRDNQWRRLVVTRSCGHMVAARRASARRDHVIHAQSQPPMARGAALS